VDPGLGFDIVGAEDRGHPLLYFVEAFNWFKERQKALGLEVPLILHAGETLGDGDATDGNLYDAILLGTKRIGHG
jgi:adenosine deaminase CECR1